MGDRVRKPVEVRVQPEAHLREVLGARSVVLPQVKAAAHFGVVVEQPGRQILKVERQERIRVLPEKRWKGTDHIATVRPQLLPGVGESMRPVGSPDRDDKRGPAAKLVRGPFRRQNGNTVERRTLPLDPVVGERERLDAVAAQAGERAAPEPARTHQDDVASAGKPIELVTLRCAHLGRVARQQRVELPPLHLYQMVFPPSTTRFAPVTNAAASEQR